MGMRWRRMVAAALAVMLMVQLYPIPTVRAQNEEPYLRVDAGLGTGLVATMTGGRGMDVNISSNTRWKLYVAEGTDWIGLSVTGGSGDGTFYTVIAENKTGRPREGLICIEAEGCEPIWIKVYQGQTGEQQNLTGKFDLNRFAVNNEFAVYCTPDGKVEATVDEYVTRRREEYAVFKGLYGLTCTEEEYVNEYEEISLHEDYSRIRQLNDVVGVSTTSMGSSAYALLRANGTVELSRKGQYALEYFLGYDTTEYRSWSNIKQVELGSGILLGLREDGRVESICWDMTDSNRGLQPIGIHPSQWEDVVQIAADEACFGLKRDGTVYYYGQGKGDHLWSMGDFYDFSQVSEWTDIVQLSTYYYGHVVGLKSDGTVVAAGNNDYGACNVGHVRNAVQVDTSYTMTACLLEDGTVELIGEKGPDPMGWRLPDVSQLKDVCAVYVTEYFLIAVMQDGSVRAVGDFPVESYLNGGFSGDCRPAMYATEKWNMAAYVGNGAQQAAEPAGRTSGLPQTPVVTGVSAAQIKQNETVTFTVRGTPADWVFVYIDGKKRTNEGFSIGADGTAQFTRTVSSAGRHTFQFSAYANDAESELSDAVVIDVESVEIAVPEQTPAQQELPVQKGSGAYRIYIDNEYFKDQGTPNGSYLTLRKGQKFRVVVKNADNYGIIDPLDKGFEIKIVDDSGYTLRIRNDGQIEAMNSGKATVALYYNGKPIDETLVYVNEVQPAEHWYNNVKFGIGMMRLDQAEKLDWSHGLAWTSNVNIFNFKSKWREDDKKNFPEGYFDVSFDVYSTSPVSYGVAAYDLYGNVVGPKVIIQPEMNTWNIVEEFVDWGEATLGMFNGKLLYGENELYRTKTSISLKVPDGGYIGFLQLVNDEDVKLANYAEAVLGLYKVIKDTLGLKKTLDDPVENVDTLTLGGELKKIGLSYDMDKIVKKGLSPNKLSDAFVSLICGEKSEDVTQAIINSIPQSALKGAVNEAENRLLSVFLQPGYQIKQLVNIFGKSLAELGIYSALTATEPTSTAIDYIFFPYMSFEDDSPGWTEEVLPITAENGEAGGSTHNESSDTQCSQVAYDSGITIVRSSDGWYGVLDEENDSIISLSYDGIAESVVLPTTLNGYKISNSFRLTEGAMPLNQISRIEFPETYSEVSEAFLDLECLKDGCTIVICNKEAYVWFNAVQCLEKGLQFAGYAESTAKKYADKAGVRFVLIQALPPVNANESTAVQESATVLQNGIGSAYAITVEYVDDTSEKIEVPVDDDVYISITKGILPMTIRVRDANGNAITDKKLEWKFSFDSDKTNGPEVKQGDTVSLEDYIAYGKKGKTVWKCVLSEKKGWWKKEILREFTITIDRVEASKKRYQMYLSGFEDFNMIDKPTDDNSRYACTLYNWQNVAPKVAFSVIDLREGVVLDGDMDSYSTYRPHVYGDVLEGDVFYLTLDSTDNKYAKRYTLCRTEKKDTLSLAEDCKIEVAPDFPASFGAEGLSINERKIHTIYLWRNDFIIDSYSIKTCVYDAARVSMQEQLDAFLPSLDRSVRDAAGIAIMGLASGTLITIDGVYYQVNEGFDGEKILELVGGLSDIAGEVQSDMVKVVALEDLLGMDPEHSQTVSWWYEGISSLLNPIDLTGYAMDQYSALNSALSDDNYHQVTVQKANGLLTIIEFIADLE